LRRDLGHLEARDQTLGIVAGLIVRDRLQLRILAGIFFVQLLATLILVDGTQVSPWT
jgi:hypothetical protein